MVGHDGWLGTSWTGCYAGGKIGGGLEMAEYLGGSWVVSWWWAGEWSIVIRR